MLKPRAAGSSHALAARATRPRSALAIRATRLHVALVALLFLLQGCAMLGGTAGNPFEERAAAEEIEILVRNLNFSQVTVYTARSGSGQRLGIVPGKGEATFKLRWTLPDIRLRVRPLAGREFYTETLSVAPGELLELVIPPR